MRTSLLGIAQKAKAQKKHRFRDLYRLLNEENLLICWREIKKEAAYGVDKISAQEYERELVRNVKNLVQRLKENRYRAKMVRRKYIPKENGKTRPLGIPAVEDKLVQLAVARILEAIYEQDFLGCSYGYRPDQGVHDAVEEISRKLQFGAYRYIVEADIRGYFDTIDHEWLKRMLQERIDDAPLVRLIWKWLKAGVLETDGRILHPMTGTPQGGIVSPVLANIYLHYALDLWFEKIFKRKCRSKAFEIRYADDFICGFERKEEAENFYRELDARLGKFGLRLSEEKTRVLGFDRNPKAEQTRFDFLGFEFSWGKDRKGRVHLKIRTSRKKLRSSLKRFTEWIKEKRSWRIRLLFGQLNAKLRGYYTHYGIRGNWDSLNEFFCNADRILFKWLNRRSQKRSFNWKEYEQLKQRYRILKPRLLAKPRIRMPTLNA